MGGVVGGPRGRAAVRLSARCSAEAEGMQQQYTHECVTFKMRQIFGWREAENSTDQVASARASAAPVLQYHGHSTAPTW